MSSERERQTLDLLLVTLITPAQMLWGKLLSGLRVSSVLTGFLMWPVVLACVMPIYWTQSVANLGTMLGYFVIVGLACVTTALTALVCSTLFSKTSTSLIASYLTIAVLFLAPLAGRFFADTFYRGQPAAEAVAAASAASPFAAAFALPLQYDRTNNWDAPAAEQAQAKGEPVLFVAHVVWSLLYNGVLFLLLAWLFRARWRVAD